MCRIYGQVGGCLDHHQHRVMAALQRHGGPDGRFFAHGDGWALGNNRLAIMDLAGGAQPFELGRDIRAVFNGEIYNHNELRLRLHALGYLFGDHCDGNVIPALYHHYGLDFVDHLDGMYAVAIMDLRAEPTLVLATDHAGMKPLYYHWNRAASELYFASELPALLTVPGIGSGAWPGGLDAYLTTKTPFGEQTMYADIEVLPRAATAVFTARDGLTINRRRSGTPPAVRGETLDQAADRVREVLRDETHRLALADVPVSTITSGGLDSSLVTGLLAERVPGLHAFNIAYAGDWPFDEKRYAHEVSAACGARYHQVEADPADFPALLDDVVWHLGQPNADPITISTYLLFDAIHRAGFKVTLSGDAADEIFGGYDRIRTALRGGAGWDRDYVDALAAVPARLRTELYTADYRDYLRRNGSASDEVMDLLRGDRHGADRLDVITEFETEHRLPAYHLRRVDHLSMAHSVEVRVPFCQRRVIDTALRLPAEQRVDGGEVKRALYAAARGLVPRSVLERPKQPFTLPITAMITADQPLMNYAREVLVADRIGADGQLDGQAVTRLLDRQNSHPTDTTALAVWSLLIYQLWSEQAGDRRSARPTLREAA